MINAIEEIKNAKKNNRISHAYIISNGIEEDRLKFAFEFVKIILGDSISNNDPDIKWIRKDENKNVISIKQVRDDIIPFVAKMPYRYDKKIIIIEDGQLLNKESSNALLKTLEEPTASSIILILVSDENKLIDTIKSRAVLIRLKTKNININDELYYGGRDIISRVLKNRPSYQTIKWTENLLKDSKKKIDKDKAILLIDFMERFIRDIVVSKYNNTLIEKKENISLSSEVNDTYISIMKKMFPVLKESRENIVQDYNINYMLKKMILELYEREGSI
ncbi:MAG: hypothetical protein LBD41_05885 [Clostridiales Family XIII bacterium]|jgi:hypothetical protein|nr:hypothetical protein [Clostridiales Family XIII bacterium]